MSFTAPLFAAVVDAIKAACTDAVPAGTFAVSKARVWQANLPQANGQLPAVVVRLPTTPYDAGNWSGSGNTRDQVFKVEVGLVAQLPSDAGVAHPYGDGTNAGILTLTDDLINVLENARATFLAASSKLVDYSVVAAAFQKEDASTASATVSVTFKVRYIAGNR